MRSRSKASRGRFGTPARWARTWPIVIVALVVLVVPGKVLGDRVVERDQPALDELVDDEVR